MPTFNPELIQIMRAALEEVMTKIPAEQATQGVKRWSRLSEQNFRIDKWSVCRGYAAKRRGSGVK